ncbi:hypothetical protein [Azospirillum brasilense]|uniref:hypothetical protein n=1 Tax=Azospirillum brasilense TaxID=192 RepID=UPI001177D71F|nr:hypothetical protein [Azospirillum brasilense]
MFLLTAVEAAIATLDVNFGGDPMMTERDVTPPNRPAEAETRTSQVVPFKQGPQRPAASQPRPQNGGDDTSPPAA